MIFNLAKGQKGKSIKESNGWGIVEIDDSRPKLTKHPY